jgi:hypothetical protein
MAKPDLEIKLEKKEFLLDGDSMNLNQNFISVEADSIYNSEKRLTLRYLGKKDSFPELELERIYNFIDLKGYSENINVSSCYCGIPNISLVGIMNLTISP